MERARPSKSMFSTKVNHIEFTTMKSIISYTRNSVTRVKLLNTLVSSIR